MAANPSSAAPPARRSILARLRIDPYILLIIGMVVLASILPARGEAAEVVDYATNFAIALLFFLYGARLSREAVMAGVTNWKLQLVVFLSTYLLFPILAIGLSYAMRPALGEMLALGIVFVGVLPSTVQSSIAFTSIARGNVPAALCAASVSNLVGIVLTPLLVGVLMTTNGESGISFGAIRGIMLQLLLPFVLGQLVRRWLMPVLNRHKQLVGYVDRSSILFVVYGAFSEGVVNGLWHQVDVMSIVVLLLANAALLAVVMLLLHWYTRAAGFSREDRITILFCGSKKSLASGIPMASLLFSGQAVSMIVLPIMLFHQIQLMVCATLATRWGREAAEAERAAAAPAPAVASQRA
ncbi:Transporter, Sodium/bile acid symporter family [Roseomonas mucosa]|uniref:Bile acid:sodium symporter n=1 Tax=Roseomonas mucosa TaxID=207340 RepID=A0A1S8D335_9PROT|nr:MULTISPECIES: bile acid:sodium symporter family protein [Roseomonas]MDT8262802.1 bile acid:sodium symporter family protein [Roseomonas sp. DSM 102946]AWV21986.1 Transporter, Sodium/bile acid symporter family [Roseomonas mucosa]MCG7353450.1 bile acid:sodium symporter [Roseomonas mucosa]MCG7358786.1 bile acid:sodium symporter [Roseomonas mucosa]MDT8275487.1 bile acid:sodium symporter family protein [Roseomonas mucosa]